MNLAANMSKAEAKYFLYLFGFDQGFPSGKSRTSLTPSCKSGRNFLNWEVAAQRLDLLSLIENANMLRKASEYDPS